MVLLAWLAWLLPDSAAVQVVAPELELAVELAVVDCSGLPLAQLVVHSPEPLSTTITIRQRLQQPPNQLTICVGDEILTSV